MKVMCHASALATERNQCDGCAVSAPFTDMGNHRYIDGSLIACTADRYQSSLADPGYERRCIVLDAERAARSPGDPSKLCFWAKGTPQHDLWMNTYYANVRAS